MRELNYIDETIEKDENPALRIGSVGRSALSTVYLMDCIEGMKQFPDKIFDLAVVDPPYGIAKWSNGSGANTLSDSEKNKINNWDAQVPTKEYYRQLFRVSKNQIVWGGNYFFENLGNCYHMIIWDKKSRGMHLADGEFAWTSYKKTAMRIFEKHLSSTEAKGITRIHATQKPICLYDWIFKNYASEGNLILDTHLGSQSSRIAANKAGLDFVGFEIDREYFDNGNKRFKNFVSQGVLF